jgi:signal-transduction protein with cAMP-binding, CBS, and nucleotidyltransferase domain
MQQKLFFIVYGTVAVYQCNGEEVIHLKDGNMFGELDFFLQEGKETVC